MPTQTQAYMQKAQGLPGVYCVALNRPEAKNAISLQLLRELRQAVDSAAANPSTRVLIIHSSKPGAFCAGADLKERRGMTDEQITQFLDDLNDLCNKIEHLRVPTIAAIDGPAMGGGLEIALACDMRVAASSVDKIGLPECRMGIIPGAGGTQRMPRLIGVSRAKELIFTGRIMDAEKALGYGLVDHVTLAGETALERALALATEMQTSAPLALIAAKEAIARGMEESCLENAMRHERTCYESLLGTQDRLEALEAFRQRRSPVFVGK